VRASRRLRAGARRCPRIPRVTGTDRLILKIVARSIAHLDDIIGALARYGTPIVSIVLASKSRPILGPA
jgi:hypothetical protein